VESDRPEAQIYQLRAVLRGISPVDLETASPAQQCFWNRQLRGASSVWGTNIDRLCGIDDQPAHRQAVRQETANAMDPTRTSSVIAGSSSDAK
jgi:hypothetical protein